jgi:hypothetical protein
MKPIRIFSAAVLLLFLGTTPRSYPEQKQEQQDKNKEQHARQQDQKKQKNTQPQDKNRQQQQRVQQQQHAQQQDQNRQRQQHVQLQDQNRQRQQHIQQQQLPKQQRQQQANRPLQQQAGEPHTVWQQQRAHSWQSEHRTWQQRGGYVGYRIPDDRFRVYFGRNHGFRIHRLPMVVIGGYPRFQYGGYWFSLVDPWPEYWSNNWYENDDVYVDYFHDGYYLYNRRHPGNRIAINVYLN